MLLRRFFIWLGAFFSNRFFIIVLQFIVSIALIFFTNILLQNNPSISLVASLGLIALGFLAASQTYVLTRDFRHYMNDELLGGLVSLQGKSITHVIINKSFDKIIPGDEYNIDFVVEGRQIIRQSNSKTVTPVLYMTPALFRGNMKDTNGNFCTWRGSPVRYNLNKDGTWTLSGRINFNTEKINTVDKINPWTTKENSVTLKLSFEGSNGFLFDLELERIPLYLITPHEIFQYLIDLGTLKKLPSGYHVLAVSEDHKFHTNLIFITNRFLELKLDEAFCDQVSRLEAAIARLISDSFTTIVNQYPSKSFGIEKYDPEGYESEVNSLALIETLLNMISGPKRANSKGNVLFALYQTREFLIRLEREDRFGICLFGFTSIAPPNIHVIFDLCSLELSHEETSNPCRIDHVRLEQLSVSSREFFEKYAPRLSASLDIKPGEQLPSSQSTAAALLPRDVRYHSERLENLLQHIRIPAQTSVRYGCFVNSEPAITSYWTNLGIFADALTKTGDQDTLEKAIVEVIDRAVEHYAVNDERVLILNLCSQDSGIADELPLLWHFKHKKYPTETIGIDRRTKTIYLPDQLTDIGETEDVIILIPFDSYTTTLETVLHYIRGCNNTIICIIPLFSTAKTWEYLSTFDYFDIIPLFRVHPTYPTGLIPLTGMTDYRRTKPWLFQPK